MKTIKYLVLLGLSLFTVNSFAWTYWYFYNDPSTPAVLNLTIQWDSRSTSNFPYIPQGNWTNYYKLKDGDAMTQYTARFDDFALTNPYTYTGNGGNVYCIVSYPNNVVTFSCSQSCGTNCPSSSNIVKPDDVAKHKK